MSAARKWRICPACDGEGMSSAHLGAITASEWADEWSPEQQHDYMRGGYDKPCERCEGSGKVVENEDGDCGADRSEARLRAMEGGL